MVKHLNPDDQRTADMHRLAHFIVHRRVRHADLRDAARVLSCFEVHEPGEVRTAIATAIPGILDRGAFDMTTYWACCRLAESLPYLREPATQNAGQEREDNDVSNR